jgi:hypothetical protein
MMTHRHAASPMLSEGAAGQPSAVGLAAAMDLVLKK